jgi:hypothetical protein
MIAARYPPHETAAAVAQQTHNEYEPPNVAGAGQKLLAQFTGDWDVVKTFFPANGKPIVTKGMCKQYMVQDGKFLESDFTFVNPDGTKSTGAGISGFDSKTNRFTTVWYDSRQTTMSIRQSDGTFDRKNIVLWATPLDPDEHGRKTVARAHLEEGGHLLLPVRGTKFKKSRLVPIHVSTAKALAVYQKATLATSHQPG